MNFDTLQSFQDSHPEMALGYARLNNAANMVTFIVEGESDVRFYRQWIPFDENVSIQRQKKAGVVANFKKYMESGDLSKPTLFFVDTDYDWYTSTLIDNPLFFYQMYDVEKKDGFNDLECFLVGSASYNKFMINHQHSPKKAAEIRALIVSACAVIGSYRLADQMVSQKRKLKETCAILHGPHDDSKQETEKLNIRYLCDKLLLFPENCGLADNDTLESAFAESFCNGPNGKYLDEVFKTARAIYEKWDPENEIGLCRGHDLTELLGRRLVADKKMLAPGDLNSRQFIERKKTAYCMLRDNVEQWLCACAERFDLQKFPVGKLFK